MNTIGKSLFAVLACSALSCTVMAQGGGASHGWYAGVDFGQSKLDQNTPVQAVIDQDDTSSTWALRVGYRFGKYVAIEAGYADIGDFETTYVPFCGTLPASSCGTGLARTSIDGFLFNTVGIWPVAEHFHLKANLGAIYRELDASVVISSPNGSNAGWSDTDTAFSYGIGVAVPINANFAVALDYTWYREIGLGLNLNNNILVVDEPESSVLTLGLRYSF